MNSLKKFSKGYNGSKNVIQLEKLQMNWRRQRFDIILVFGLIEWNFMFFRGSQKYRTSRNRQFKKEERWKENNLITIKFLTNSSLLLFQGFSKYGKWRQMGNRVSSQNMRCPSKVVGWLKIFRKLKLAHLNTLPWQGPCSKKFTTAHFSYLVSYNKVLKHFNILYFVLSPSPFRGSSETDN